MAPGLGRWPPRQRLGAGDDPALWVGAAHDGERLLRRNFAARAAAATARSGADAVGARPPGDEQWRRGRHCAWRQLSGRRQHGLRPFRRLRGPPSHVRGAMPLREEEGWLPGWRGLHEVPPLLLEPRRGEVTGGPHAYEPGRPHLRRHTGPPAHLCRAVQVRSTKGRLPRGGGLQELSRLPLAARGGARCGARLGRRQGAER
mmetsp:Transcript_98047/g.282824  ORF Transcript_98047/g.282824 Transcript_98047/m.282824 type:complete len:202 (-) Transcript_98047:345-950(-)